MSITYGALPGAWDHFDLVLGLGEDLLPVAADPNAVISPTSSLSSIGKVPSVYNSRGQIVGMAKWTEHVTTSAEIERWLKNPNLGICLQTRRIRAIDVDIPDADEAEKVWIILSILFGCSFPVRTRSDSSKFLVLLDCEGEIPKRRMKTKHGFIELLGTGQQCVIESTHPSGARYEWPLGWPESIPVLTFKELDELWASLAEEFAIEDPITSSVSMKKQQLTAITSSDPVVQALSEQGMVLSQASTGMLAIRCPFDDGHTLGSSITSTVYFPPHTGGYEFGHFDCKHASCAHREDSDFKEALGIRISDLFDVVEDDDVVRVVDGEQPQEHYAFEHVSSFIHGPKPKWIVQDLLPQDEIAMVYGPSGSGKSFFVLDVIMAVARGIPWCGKMVKQGTVAYMAAEGVGGARNRVRAYAQHNHITLDDVPMFVLGASPNLMERKDVKDLIAALVQLENLRVVVVDTVACVMAGADENSGKDMGRVIAHCKMIHQATGALVVLIHHSGKDVSRGARGWSGMRGALGAEISITRNGRERVAAIEKQKDGADTDMEFGFTLEVVDMTSADDDYQVSSCIVEAMPIEPKDKRRQPVRGTEQTLLDWITDYQDEVKEWPLIADILEALPRAGNMLETLKSKNQIVDNNGRIERRTTDRREPEKDITG